MNELSPKDTMRSMEEFRGDFESFAWDLNAYYERHLRDETTYFVEK